MERRLYREPEERRIAGVCGGLADHLGLDPTVVRLLAVSLVLLAGVGVVLYLVAALVIPERPATVPRERVEAPEATDLVTPPMLALLVLAVALLAVTDRDWFPGPGAGVALLVLGIWLLVRNGRDPQTPVPTGEGGGAVPSGDVPSEPEVTSQPALMPGTESEPEPTAELGTDTTTEIQSPTPAPSRILGVVVVTLLAIVVVTLVQLAIDDRIDVGVGDVLGAGLVVVGIGLVVGAWWGRTRALIGLGLPIVLLLVAAHLVDAPLDADANADERTVLVTSAADLVERHELLAGHLTLDLRDLPVAVLRRDDLATLQAQVGVGQLTVLLPDSATVDVDAEVALGQLTIEPFVDEIEGLGVQRAVIVDGDEGGGRLTVDVGLGVGDLEVAHA